MGMDYDMIFSRMSAMALMGLVALGSPASPSNEWTSCTLWDPDDNPTNILYLKEWGSRYCGYKEGELVAVARPECCKAQRELRFTPGTRCVFIDGNPRSCSVTGSCRSLFWNVSFDGGSNLQAVNSALHSILPRFPMLEELEIEIDMFDNTPLKVIDCSAFAGVKNLRRLAVVGPRLEFVNLANLNALDRLEFLRIGSEYASGREPDSSLFDLSFVRDLDGLHPAALKEADLRGCFLFRHETLTNFQGLVVLRTPLFFRPLRLPSSLAVLDMSDSIMEPCSESYNELLVGLSRLAELHTLITDNQRMIALPPCWYLGDGSDRLVYHRHVEEDREQTKLASADLEWDLLRTFYRKNLSSSYCGGKSGETVAGTNATNLMSLKQAIPNSKAQLVHIDAGKRARGINKDCRELSWDLILEDEYGGGCANRVLETCLLQFPNLEALEVRIVGRKKSFEVDFSVFKQLKKLKRLAVVGNRMIFVNMSQLNELTRLEYLRLGSEYASMDLHEDNYFLCGLAVVQSLDALRLNALKELDMRGCYLTHHETLVNLQGLSVLHTPTFFCASSLPTSVKVLDISSSVRCYWFGSGINSVSEDMKPFQNLETVIAGRWENDLELPSDWVLTDKLPSDSRIRSVYRRQPGGSVRSSRIRPRPRNERVDNGK